MSERLTFRLTYEDHARLLVLAEEMNLPAGWIARHAVERFLRNPDFTDEGELPQLKAEPYLIDRLIDYLREFQAVDQPSTRRAAGNNAMNAPAMERGRGACATTTMHNSCVVCPYCGYEHGDAWEWCNQDVPRGYGCDGCGRDFQAWAEYDVVYRAKGLAE